MELKRPGLCIKSRGVIIQRRRNFIAVWAPLLGDPACPDYPRRKQVQGVFRNVYARAYAAAKAKCREVLQTWICAEGLPVLGIAWVEPAVWVEGFRVWV